MAIVDVIKYEGSSKMLVWKHSSEDFSTASQLIVHESQEAVFFKDGQALDLFGPGRYTLHTQNIPLLNKLINLPFGGESPFHCEVYFVNKAEEMAIRWGTDKRVAFVDNSYTPPLALSIGVSGEMSIAVQDSRKLIVKLVGTEAALSQEKFVSYMRGIINKVVKPVLARIMNSGEYSIFTVDAQTDELSSELHELLIPEFADYGIDLRRFMIIDVAKPEDDSNYQRLRRALSDQSLNVQEAQARQNEAIKEAETRWKVAQQDAQKTLIDAQAAGGAKVIDAQATAEKRRLEGYTYQQERGYDVAQTVASNQAVGEFTNLGIGMGMISGIGGSLSGTVAGMTSEAISSSVMQQPQTANAGQQGPDIFGVSVQPADSQGQMPVQQVASPVQGESVDPLAEMKLRIEKLKLMREAGLLSDEEFEAQRQRLISEI